MSNQHDGGWVRTSKTNKYHLEADDWPETGRVACGRIEIRPPGYAAPHGHTLRHQDAYKRPPEQFCSQCLGRGGRYKRTAWKLGKALDPIPTSVCGDIERFALKIIERVWQTVRDRYTSDDLLKTIALASVSLKYLDEVEAYELAETHRDPEVILSLLDAMNYYQV